MIEFVNLQPYSALTNQPNMAQSSHYVSLTLLQKEVIYKEIAASETKRMGTTHAEIFALAKPTFFLPAVPRKGTTSRVSASPTSHLELVKSLFKIQDSYVRGTESSLKKILHKCICDICKCRINLSLAVIQQKFLSLHNLLNNKLPMDKQCSLKMSTGWLDKLRNRWGLKMFRSCGDSGEKDESAIAQEPSNLRSILARYDSKDTYNVDKYGLFYKTALDKTMASAPLRGQKNLRTGLLSCCLSMQTDPIEWNVFIGSAQKLRALRNMVSAELGLDYAAHRKGWMTP